MVCCCELLWRQGKQIFESAPSLHCWYCNKVAACRFLKQDWKLFKSLFKLVSLVTCFANYQVGLLDRLGHKPDSPAGKVQLSLQEVIHHLLYLGHFLLRNKGVSRHGGWVLGNFLFAFCLFSIIYKIILALYNDLLHKLWNAINNALSFYWFSHVINAMHCADLIFLCMQITI